LAEETQPASQITYQRADDFTDQYANNVFFEASLWDLKLLFGQLDQGLGQNFVVQHGSVTLPWPQAKVLAYFLQVNLTAHELRNGRIIIPPGLIPAMPKQVAKEFANDPKVVETHKVVAEMQKAFFAQNPEAAPPNENR
jgi:hypothetical protein